MFGFYGRVLDINLTDKSFSILDVPEATQAACLGGKGLSTHLLLEHNPVRVDPLSEENRLIFATGPFCGTRLWGGSRWGVFTKSPLTGAYCESYSGGKAPEAVDAAGFDAVMLRGISDAPVALSIHPDGCEFFAADQLWGKDAFETEDLAKEQFLLPRSGYKKSCALAIGPAAEKLVRFAVISNDYWRCAGRGGAGTVMGSKRVKAIVFQGDRKREMGDAKGVAAFAKEFSREAADNPGVKAYKGYGTTMMVALMNTAKAFPAKYWSQGTCEHWEKISGETYKNEHDVTHHACAKCFMACGRKATLKKGRHAGLKLEGPEYETIYAFGGLCMIDDMAEVAYLNDLCDRLGVDTITAGNLCGFAIEAGLRGKHDFPVKYNDADGVARLIELMAAREGLGAVLAQGIVHAAKHFGLEDLAIHVKGMEPPGYDPRVLKGMGLAYATSDRGACHLRATFYKPELAGMIAPDTTDGKAELFVEFEDRLTLFDTLILCRFYRDLYDWDTLAEAISLTTGVDFLGEEGKKRLRKIAAHVSDMTRLFNLREGVGMKDDILPERFYNEPLPTGHAITKEELEFMRGEYYELRGWNEEGVPQK